MAVGFGLPSSRASLGGIMRKGVAAPAQVKSSGSAATAGMPQLHGQAIQSRKNLNTLKVASQKAGARPGTIAPQYQAQAQRQAAISGGSFATSPQMQALSGAGGGGYTAQGTINYGSSQFNPQEMNISAQNNPQLEALTGQMQGMRNNLAAGSDQDAVLALQRQRDLTSGLAKEFGTGAAQRGVFGSGAAAQDLNDRVLSQGQQQMGALNANLAADARAKQFGALGQQADLVNQQAALGQADKQFALQSWQARDAAQRAQADLALRQQQIQSGQGMQLASLLGNMFTGL